MTISYIVSSLYHIYIQYFIIIGNEWSQLIKIHSAHVWIHSIKELPLDNVHWCYNEMTHQSPELEAYSEVAKGCKNYGLCRYCVRFHYRWKLLTLRPAESSIITFQVHVENVQCTLHHRCTIFILFFNNNDRQLLEARCWSD